MFQARGGTVSALAVLTILSVSPSFADSVYTPWYWQPPLQGTAVGHYYSYHPDQVPGYPFELRGYPVPIYSINGRRQASAVRYRIAPAHAAWCQNRWLSYRASDNSYQPLFGLRRQCWSPYL